MAQIFLRVWLTTAEGLKSYVFIIYFRARNIMYHLSMFHAVMWQAFSQYDGWFYYVESIFWRIGLFTLNAATGGEHN